MVKLFGKKGREENKDFKYDTSLKLKSLPKEEYAHVAYAFQVSLLRLERMLKESLLEGFITSTTLEKITQEFNFPLIKNMDIPKVESLKTVFGMELPPESIKKTPEISTPEPTPEPSPTPVQVEPEVIPEPEPIEPSKPLPVSQPSTKPSFTFSVPEPAPAPTSPETKPPTEPVTKPVTPSAPTIPKISFPSIAKSSDPLGQVRARREEDRATGIAILRKQMLTELKKIRTVVSEDQQ